MSGPFSAFKLHSNYTPNPTINISPSSSAPEITPNLHCICAHCTNFFSFNIHHRLGEEEEGISITSSSRWNPTPAQLLYLEQLYRQGTKTPTAQQIQLIASQLRRFGNIQAKNVFYWFQNHKARDRQKRRRSDMEISPPSPPALQHARQGLRGTGYEVKETNKWASSSNCSALAEVSDSLNRAERGAYRRTQREERETQILRVKREESLQAKCQIRDHMSSFFLSNSNKNLNIKSIKTSNPTNYYCYDDEEEEVADERTLKLFPLKRSDEDDESIKDKDKFCSFNNAFMDSDEITSNKFFEFLPLRK